MEPNIDQRIINTKQDLYDALFNIIKTNTSLKVLDICKKANITPMTFYHHYGDKTELLIEAIKNQLDLKLPIPTKLKPNSLKHLIYYLLNFLSEFSTNNKELIIISIKQILNKIDKSYLGLLIKILNLYINKELSLLFSKFNPITINIWSDIITYGFIGLFFKRLFTHKNIEFPTIKDNFNLFINNYCFSN